MRIPIRHKMSATRSLFISFFNLNLRHFKKWQTEKLNTHSRCKLANYQNKYEAYRGTKDAALAHSTYVHQVYRREYFRSINI